MNKITIRPSSLASFVGCAWQWYNTFILGKKTMPNVRAFIGTGIHKGAEILWTEAINTQKIAPNITAVNDAAIEAFDNEIAQAELPVNYDLLSINDAQKLVLSGIKTYTTTLAPKMAIPDKVEIPVAIELDHPIVTNIRGTIDYISKDTISDIKTSKRKIIPASYVLQQSMYKYLAEYNNITVTSNTIQGIVFNKEKIYSSIDTMSTNVAQVKYITNNLLKRLTALYKGGDPDILFPGNPKYYLCSEIYCTEYSVCPFVNGIIGTKDDI